MKSSDLFLWAVEEEGMKYVFVVLDVFVVPRELNADMMISLIESPIGFIMTQHGQGAVFMADLL